MTRALTGKSASIVYGSGRIVFELRRLPRKTMEIAVHPDRSVVVKAPTASEQQEVMRRVHKRAAWIQRQLRYFEQFEPRTPPRRYVSGESHLYLGRKYRLKIRKSRKQQVLLSNGYFYIQTPSVAPDTVQKLLEEWYLQKASTHFQQAFQLCWQKFSQHGIARPQLKIKKMKTRWGSLSKKGGMTLNLELIKAPKECIEYVVVHELCHLLQHNHGPRFYKLLENSLPDWGQRKHKLEMTLA